jgi:hypothetical protein
MAHDVFICHASRDKRVADAICSEFEASGLKCWVAPRDIPVGDDWMEAIRHAIESAPLFALIFSENANSARHIEREIANAFYTQRTMVAFRLTKALPRRDLLLYLSNCRWIDWDGEPGAPDAKALVARTKAILAGSGLASRCDPYSNSLVPRTAMPYSVYARRAAAINVPLRNPRIVQGIAMSGAVIFAIGLLWWLRADQTNIHWPPDHRSSASANYTTRNSPSPPAKEDAPVPVPHYEFSRFGLWVPAGESSQSAIPASPTSTTSPSPDFQTTESAPAQSPDANQNGDDNGATLARRQNAGGKPGKTEREVGTRERHQGRSRAKVHYRRATPSKEFRLASVKRWVKAFFHE